MTQHHENTQTRKEAHITEQKLTVQIANRAYSNKDLQRIEFCIFFQLHIRVSHLIYSVWHQDLSPLIIKAGTVKAHYCEDKYDERCKLDEHSSRVNQISVSEDNRNSKASNSRCSGQKFSSINPAIKNLKEKN